MLTREQAAIVKGLLARGEKQHNIAAYFGENGGRIAEVKTGARFPDVGLAPKHLLPTRTQMVPWGFIMEEARRALSIAEAGVTSARARLNDIETKLQEAATRKTPEGEAAMNDLVARDRQDVSIFDPGTTRAKLAHLDGDILSLRKLQDWPELERAVDAKIAEQTAFVATWDREVNPQGNQPNVAPRQHLSVEEAFERWGVRKDTVSRWRTSLADTAAYRERLMLGPLRAANLVTHTADPNALRPQPNRDGEADFWPTPLSLVAAFIRHVLPLLPPAPIWECAAGDGRLAWAISESGRRVFSSDLYPQDGSRPRDFLTESPPQAGVIVATNPPYNNSDAFLERGLALLSRGAIAGFVLLLRHDHLQAAGRVAAFNRATFEIHCNWRPIWIDGTEGQPRWSFHWLGWGGSQRQPPFYVQEDG